MTIILLSGTDIAKTMNQDAKVHRAVERLLDSHVVSVYSESRNYCYKTFTGKIGVVDIDFINDRVRSRVF